ncbi:MAG: hypothetical protein GF329_20925, partial [Candidatus Lokiarchaeota archaeon]|nr:hypothetical protein [Candidatus Lokiarchaeota archaeon]
IIYNSILPEIEFAPTNRSKIEARLEGKDIILTVYALDFIILRAIVNSYLKWFTLSSKILKKIE